LRCNSPYTQTSGVTRVDGGILDVSTTYALLLRGGTLSGQGTVRGNIVNYAGDVTPGSSVGLMSVEGDYTNGGRGRFTVEVGGATSFDVLDVTGDAELGGTLNITLLSPFVPVSGDDFEIMRFASRVGEFQDVNAPCLGGGLAWVPEYTDTSVILYVLPGPDGDFDGDGLVTHVDVVAYVDCMAGPAVPVSTACADVFDFNLDGDVDLRDFACFELAFTAP
jgi:hypothetical protein